MPTRQAPFRAAPKRPRARICPKTAVSQRFQKALLIAGLQATRIPKSGSKRRLARMWPKAAFSQCLRRTDWRPVGGDDRGLGTSELPALSLSDSEEPESEEPSTDSDQEPSSDAFGDVNMDCQSDEEPEQGSEGMGQEMDVDEESQDLDCRDCQHIEDVSGLFG